MAGHFVESVIEQQILTGLKHGDMGKNSYGCRHGLPHDLKPVYENPRVKIEVCQICNKKFRWNKGYKGRVQNAEYLKAHARNFCQRRGPTKRLYNQIYKKENI